MRDEFRSRSPNRGRHRSDFDNEGNFRARHGHDHQDDHHRPRHATDSHFGLQSSVANLPTGQRDYSRSPERRKLYEDYRGSYRRQQDSDGREDHLNILSHSSDSHRKQDYSPPRHRSRQNWDDRNSSYDDMYDDGRRTSGRHGERAEEDHAAPAALAAATEVDPVVAQETQENLRIQSFLKEYLLTFQRLRFVEIPSTSACPIVADNQEADLKFGQLHDALLVSSIAAELPSIDLRISSSKGNRRAFVQFDAVEQAAIFIKEHYPKLLVRLQHSTDDIPDGKFTAYIHYARNPRDEGDTRLSRTADWHCPQCDFANFSSRLMCKVCGTAQAAPSNWEQSLTGAADVADGADAISQILVVHPLASFVTEDMLAKDLKQLEKSEDAQTSSSGPNKLKSTAPGADASRHGARPGSLHRVFLVREVTSGESLKYGFAEFWTLEDAAAAMTKFRMSRSLTVAGCAVQIAPTHMGVFLPEERELTPQIEHMSFYPLFNPALRARYRDLHAFPSQFLITEKPPVSIDPGNSNAAEDQESDGKKAKKRKADANVAGSAAKKPVAMAGQMAVWQRKHDELHGDGSDGIRANSNKPSGDGLLNPEANKAPIKISLNNATNLGLSPTIKTDAESDEKNNMSTDSPVVSLISAQSSSENSLSLREETYLDRSRLMCLICMRKYKSTDEIDIHEKSRNHKTAMEDDEKVKAALPRLATRDRKTAKQGQVDDSNTTQYRDRAKERRDVYNQPDRPKSQAHESKNGGESSKKTMEERSKPVASKGAGMLAKMGWTTGSGLGAHGSGRTDALTTNAYQGGVGLGAEGSNLGDAVELAEKNTKNKYSDYLHSVQDKARERYNQMG